MLEALDFHHARSSLVGNIGLNQKSCVWSLL